MGVISSYIWDEKKVEDIEISQRGVRLEALQKLCEDINGGRMNLPMDDEKRNPGEQLVDGIVKPLTDTSKCSYASYLYQNPNTTNLVGPCNAFVSQPWSSTFQTTVAAIVEYEKTLPMGSPPQFYFVDYCAINQHNPSDDFKQLGNLIESSNKLLLMANSWKKPVALTRLWCIFEVALAALKNTEIEIILSPEEIGSFQQALRTNVKQAWDFVGELFQNVDSKKATASKEIDVEKIGIFIENELGGFIKVDTIVADGLRKWFVRSAKTLLKNFPEADKGSDEHAHLIWQVAEFRYSQSQYSEAAQLYDEAAAIYKKNNNEEWLTCEKDRIFMFRKMGKLKEALPMAIQNLENQEKLRGAMHLGTLSSKRCLGAIQKDLGMNKEAEENLRAILEVFEKAEEPNEHQILVTKYQLAETLRNLGRLDDAVNMYQDLIDRKTKKLGRDHPSTLNCVLMKARCLALKNMPELALPLYEETLPILRMKWGAKDPSVINGNKWIEEARSQLLEKKD